MATVALFISSKVKRRQADWLQHPAESTHGDVAIVAGSSLRAPSRNAVKRRPAQKAQQRRSSAAVHDYINDTNSQETAESRPASVLVQLVNTPTSLPDSWPVRWPGAAEEGPSRRWQEATGKTG